MLSDYPLLQSYLGIEGYLPPSIGLHALQVIGGTLFLGTFDYLISSIIFDAKGHVECEEHARVLEGMVTLREENDMLKLLLQEKRNTLKKD